MLGASPTKEIFGGRLAEGNYTVLNGGDEDSEAFSVRVFLSLDRVLGESDYLMAEHRYSGMVSGESVNFEFNAVLPRNADPGTYLFHP